jgi:phenylalanine-4-hydroxylase
VLRTPYRSDVFQPRYFVLDGMDELRTGIDLVRLEQALASL